MKIESIDPKTLAVQVSCKSDEGWEIPVRLSSLIVVAADCHVPSIRCEMPADLTPAVRGAVEHLVARNAVVTLLPRSDSARQSAKPVCAVIGRADGFVCIRDFQNEGRHSILVAGTAENVERAARYASILAAVLGFSSLVAFEIRFSVYELLMNVVEHGLEPDSYEWIQLDLERKENKLLVSIIDKGAAFDPNGGKAFNLAEYIGRRERRGLGLIMMRRVAEQLTYRREWGCNKVIWEKSISSRGAMERTGKEESMAQFQIAGPTPRGDGTHALALSGDLDAKGALLMEHMLSQLVEKRMLRVVLDFEKVSFISSAGVGILLGLVSTLRDAKGDAVFVKIPSKVSSVFRLLNLEDYFTMRDSVASDV